MKEILIKIARETIENFVKSGKTISYNPKEIPKEFLENRGVFVSIYKNVNGKKVLRGCIGRVYPEKPLIENLIESSLDVIFDPRFPPLTEDELSEIEIEISILTNPEKINFENPKELLNSIKENEDGIIIEKNGRSAVFLPQVWEVLNDKITFLSNLCLKAGLKATDWLSDCNVYKFKCEIIRENAS